MPLNSDLKRLSNSNGDQFHRFLQLYDQILDILKDFEGNYDKKLNYTKLAEVLNVSSKYSHELINIILKNQEIFNHIFKYYYLEKKREDNTVYLVTRKKIPDIIYLTKSQIKVLNDIIYTFKFVKRGKGFDLVKNGTTLSTNLKSLLNEYPYLFEMKNNGLVYPSFFGLKLGDLIISYNTGNKEFTELTIDNHTVMVLDHE